MKTLPTHLRKKIIDSLKAVKHPGIAGDCMRTFATNEMQKSDKEVIECVADIKCQIRCNPVALQRVLGNEFNFIQNLHIPAKYSKEAVAV